MCFHFRFPKLLPFTEPAVSVHLSEEMVRYNLLEEDDLQKELWQSCRQDGILLLDHFWHCLGKHCLADGTLQFDLLAKVALLVLTIPHSNAAEERVFSMVSKNKTKFRSKLDLAGTLSSILISKLALDEGKGRECYKFHPEKSVLKTAKKATMSYNQAHSSSS